jgi:hypothetical protein
VSTAYYALFHLLGESAAEQFSAVRLRGFVRRGLEHGRMRQVAAHITSIAVSGARPKFSLAGVVISPDLQDVAAAFVTLQQARHEADYDLMRAFTPTEVAGLVQAAENAFAAWTRIRKSADADAFIIAMLFWNDRRQ